MHDHARTRTNTHRQQTISLWPALFLSIILLSPELSLYSLSHGKGQSLRASNSFIWRLLSGDHSGPEQTEVRFGLTEVSWP